MKIKKIFAQEILDSRGNPTLEAEVTLEDGTVRWAAVPSGASTGKYEAVELRDGDAKRYNGLGVLKAVENVNKIIAPELIGMDASQQEKIDQKMIDLDGTRNKGKLGANAILAVSVAIARAEAVVEGKPLYEYLSTFNPDHHGKYLMPITQMNIMNGGKHADWATDIQEYMIFPIGATSIVEGIRMCAETYFHLKKVLKEKKYSVNIGDEGGFAPALTSNEEPFKLMIEAIERAGYQPGQDIALGIDVAASEFYQYGKYKLQKEGLEMFSQELADFYKKLLNKYPIISTEDVFAEDDWQGFKDFTVATANKIQVIGDDLYVTNTERLERGVKEKATNSILIKLNQIGTITETVKAILLARKNKMTAVVSHRSGETDDSFLADFVVAMGTGQIKTGAPCRGERTAKYNRLMKIERKLGKQSSYAKFPF